MIQVDLSAAEVPIEPGSTAQLSVTITNKQEHDDHVFLEIEGIDVEWYALPVPAVNIPAGESQAARVLFRIGRNSESHAGTYPFLVRARGMESGEAGVQQAALVIKPFSALQVELNPKRIASTFLHHAAMLDVLVTNLGNRDETLDLYASDPEDACAYEFETDRITVRPGHSETVHLYIEPVTRPVLGTMRLYGFTVTARSVEDSYVSASAHGQVERRALLSTLAAALLLVLLAGAIAFAALRPKPVVVRSFTANPMDVLSGSDVVLSWDASNLGEGSYIDPGHILVKSSIDSLKVQPLQTTKYVLIARGGGHQERREVVVTVRPKKIPDKAQILDFSAIVGGGTYSARGPRTPSVRIHQGDAVTLTWKVKNAVEIFLNPVGQGKGMDPRVYLSETVVPSASGPAVYTLAAKGIGGDVVTKSLTIQVVLPTESIADIVSFRARPGEIQAGQSSRLTWTVENASSVEIDNGVGGGLSPRGEFEVRPQDTTVYTLRAMDNKQNLRTKQITVRVLPPPPPPSPDTTNPTGPPGTTPGAPPGNP